MAGRRGRWVTGHSSLTTTDKDRAFAGNVLAPIMLDDWRGVSAISLDALSHRLFNIRGMGREVWPVVRVESSRAYGVWEDRCRAVQAELYPDFSYHGVPLSLRSYRPAVVEVSDSPTPRALGGPLFEVGIGIARLPGDRVAENRWDYSVISDDMWRELVRDYRNVSPALWYKGAFPPAPFAFAYYSPPPVALSVRALYAREDFQSLLRNYQQPGIGSVIYDWLQDHGVTPEDAAPFLTPGHAALFPLMLV